MAIEQLPGRDSRPLAPLPPAGDTPPRIALSEVVSSLSRALDLTEGQPLRHSVRACIIGMRLGAELGMDDERRAALYYALLLKDAVCSSNASRMAALFGADDHAIKPQMKVVDWDRKMQLALATGPATRGSVVATSWTPPHAPSWWPTSTRR